VPDAMGAMKSDQIPGGELRHDCCSVWLSRHS
jgi:hypothetical protein